MAKVRMSRWAAAGLGALLLVSLPGAAAAAPALPAGSRAPVPQRERAVPGGPVPVLPVRPDAAAAAALRGAPGVRWPAGGTGSYAATPLALSATWQTSGQTGEFSWRYPIRVPETPGQLTPQLALAYDSGGVDGHTASTNNQPSWAGEGFDLWSGSIERQYRGCADDLGGNNGQTKTGDECWF